MVHNGQKANQTTFNTALMSRTQNTSTIGRVDLLNAASVSVVDLQAVINTLIKRTTPRRVKPTGLLNGANVTFVVPEVVYVEAMTLVLINGVLVDDDDYDVVGDTFTFDVAPEVGDGARVMEIVYIAD